MVEVGLSIENAISLENFVQNSLCFVSMIEFYSFFWMTQIFLTENLKYVINRVSEGENWNLAICRAVDF